MIRVIAIGGVPGSGKTTLVKHVRKQFPADTVFKAGLLEGHYIPLNKLYILGRYDKPGVFSGTDKLSMAVQPHATQFIEKCTPGTKVLFEGDRLFNWKFLQALLNNPSVALQVIVLDAPQNELGRRYTERGSAQDPKFLAGRHTKVFNVYEKMMALAPTRCQLVQHHTPSDTVAIGKYITTWFK